MRERRRAGQTTIVSSGLLVASAVAIVLLLTWRASTQPVFAFRERQWIATEEAGRPRHDTLTRYSRVDSRYDGALVRPGGVTIEWRGFIRATRAGEIAVLVESAGPSSAWLAGRELVKSSGTPPGQPAVGKTMVSAGPHELIVRTTLPERDAWFRGALQLPGASLVRLEDAPVTLAPVTHAEAKRAHRVQRWIDSALLGLGVVTAILLARLLSDPSPIQRRIAEGSFALLVVSGGLLLPHGAGLRFWGTAFLAGADLPWRGVILGLGCVPWALAVARRGPDLSSLRLLARPALAAVVAFGLTWLLRERRVWGDGWITVALLEGSLPPGPLGEFFWKEPLDRLVAVVATAGGRVLGVGAASAVAFTSCASGALLVGAMTAGHRRGLVGSGSVVCVLTAGGALLFFGHVENYSWVSAAIAVFLLAASATVRHGTGAGRAGGLAGLAVSFHPVALFTVVPAAAVLLAAVPTRERFRVLAGGVAVPGALLAGCLLAGIAPPQLGANRFADDPHVLLSAGAAFQAANLQLVANRLVLIGSPAILLGALLALGRIGAGDTPAGVRRRLTPEQLLLVAAAAGALIHVVFLHGKIMPPVQDWDLYAPAFVPFAFLAGRSLDGEKRATTLALAAGLSAAVLLLGVLGSRTG